MSLVPPAAAVLLPELIEGRSSVSILCPVPQHAAGEPRESIKPLELFDLWCLRLVVRVVAWKLAASLDLSKFQMTLFEFSVQ